MANSEVDELLALHGEKPVDSIKFDEAKGVNGDHYFSDLNHPFTRFSSDVSAETRIKPQALQGFEVESVCVSLPLRGSLLLTSVDGEFIVIKFNLVDYVNTPPPAEIDVNKNFMGKITEVILPEKYTELRQGPQRSSNMSLGINTLRVLDRGGADPGYAYYSSDFVLRTEHGEFRRLMYEFPHVSFFSVSTHPGHIDWELVPLISD